tara:strand:+ start:252 stop:440 length:189 start_codon:yes stop_codon:yes gene_type:complete
MTHAEEVESMSDRELVAFWNILQFGRRLCNPEPDKEVLVSHELSTREIPHERNKRIIRREDA